MSSRTSVPPTPTPLSASVSTKRTSGRTETENKHSGAVQVRGMIRRVWRPRYLEIDQDGVLRYYEAAMPDPNVSAVSKSRDISMEMQAFSLPDLKQLDQESTSANIGVKTNDTQHAPNNNESTSAINTHSRNIYDDDAVHVTRNVMNNSEQYDQNNHCDDHVIVEPPSLTYNNITKSFSKESMGIQSKMGSWDNINMLSSMPSSTTSDSENETAADKNIEVMLQAESEMDTVILQRKKSDTDLAPVPVETHIPPKPAQKETLHHQIHDHRPKAVMTILSARLIDVSSLRDVHVGLPKGTHGFVFCGRQIFSERGAHGYGFGQSDGYNYDGTSSSYSHSYLGETGSITDDHFEIRDDICHPLSILSANDQYFDASRDYLCSVGTKEEAKMWVKALKWAANVASSQDVDCVASLGGMEGLSECLAATRSGRRKTTFLEGNEISIRGSFEDTVSSPIGSPVRTTRGHIARSCNDMVFEEESTDHKDLVSSLLSDSSTVMTGQHIPKGYTLVTKVRKFDIKNTAWKRLVGFEACIVYEIRLLLLSMNHMMHRSRRKQKDEDQKDDNILCWDVEQRTVFRTFDEILHVLESVTKMKSLDSGAGLDNTLKNMKESRHGTILSMANMNGELSKAVENVDGALREITSDPNLCDTKTVKQFLGLLGGSKWHGSGTSGAKREKLHVCDGNSIDDFVKKWLFAHVDEMELMQRAQCYTMLMLNNMIIETFLSATIIFGASKLLKSGWSNPSTVSLRMDSLLALLGIAFYIGFNLGSSKTLSRDENKVQRGTMSRRAKRQTSNKKAKRAISLDDDTIDDDVAFETGSYSDDSQVLSSPLPMFSDNSNLSCWSRPNHNIFVVRSKSYLRNKVKLPSAPSPFKCRGADMWLTDNPERNISRLPCVLGGKLGEENTLLVNFLLPFGNFVTYFTIPEDMPENILNIWNKFKNGDQLYRDARFKLLPVVIEGPWIVKKAVGAGTAPALLSQSIPLQYYFTHETDKKKGIYEIDVIITASRIAKGILNVVKSHTDRLTIALGFIIEATTEAELPEIVLGSCQLHSLNLELCPQLPKYYLDDSSIEGSFEED